MSNAQFWEIIDSSRERAAGNCEAQCAALETALRALPPEEIETFQDCLDAAMDAANRWDLWGAAYIIAGGCSDDGFMDFRAWLISKGRHAYESGLKDADSLAELIDAADGDCQCESFLYVPSKAWEAKTGRDFSEMPRSPRGDGDPAGDPWEEDSEEMASRFPKLWHRFERERD